MFPESAIEKLELFMQYMVLFNLYVRNVRTWLENERDIRLYDTTLDKSVILGVLCL